MALPLEARVRAQAMFYLASAFENYTVFKPAEGKEKGVTTVLDQVVSWPEAMRTVRGRKPKAA